MQRMRRWQRIGVAVGVVAIVLGGACPGLGETLADQLSTYLEQARAESGAPGISAAVAAKGRIVWAGGSGHADLNHLVPAAGHTVYNIGSVSKANTVVAIMQLVEKGDVGLDDTIQTWVPGFPRKSGEITLRHILTHTSGIRHYRQGEFNDDPRFFENRERYDSVADALAIFANDPLLFEPGAYWSYSSFATNILQAIIETTTAMGFEEYMRAHVWEPAGMLATQFDIPERIVLHRSRSYRRDEEGRLEQEPYGDVTYKFAGGGMLSTVVDQVRLGMALNRGILLARKTAELMYEPWSEPRQRFPGPGEAEAADLGFEQGLIWRIEADEKGRRFVHHTGSVIGFRAALVNFPDDDVVVAVMINTPSSPYRYARAIARTVLEEPPDSLP